MARLYRRGHGYATHNQLWPAHDTRRSELMAQSVELLNQKRDIRTYQNIYE